MPRPKHFDDEPTEVVFLPGQRVTRGDSHAQVQLRYTDTDQLAPLVNSTLDRLSMVFGQQHTWVSGAAKSIDDLANSTGAEVLAYDIAFDGAIR